MNALLLLAAIALVAVSGVPGLFASKTGRAFERLATAILTSGCLLGLVAAARSFAAPSAIDVPWGIPGARLSMRLDGIAAMFLVQIFVVAALGSLYGLGYWKQSEHPRDGRKLRLFYGLMVAGMAVLVSAKNTVFFLAGWEVMALAAFMAITTEDERAEVRESGLVYLATTRVATVSLFAFFGLLVATNGSFDFELSSSIGPGRATALFVLALVGFGLKAGIMPLHLWLPGAHANAPSHVSSLMSGVVIKMGIYGIVRTTSFFPHPPAWWGELLVALGAISGVLGVAFAIGQHDIKRLFAYSSVENIGIIVMGLGVALLGRSLGSAELVAMGLAGALLHTWNHGLFKALLFLSAGAVVHATGTREIDRFGGLAKKMPLTALYFLVGAVAICGLPPLNGFVSEYFVYLGMLRGLSPQAGHAWLAGALGAPALAMIGALAVACFVKVYGVTFLGEPRAREASRGHECGPSMRTPMAVLAALCALIGLAPRLVAPALDRAASVWAPQASLTPLFESAPLSWITWMGLGLVLATAMAAGLLRALMRGRPIAHEETWGCGYTEPRPTMQYTSSSFAQMLVELFRGPLRPKVHAPRIEGPFPRPARFHSEVPDVVLDGVVRPAAARAAVSLAWFRWVQQGSVHLYLLYVLAALVLALLVWR